MKECHNSMNKVLSYFNSYDVLSSLRWGKFEKDPLGGSDDKIITIFFENICPICREKFSFALLSNWLSNLGGNKK